MSVTFSLDIPRIMDHVEAANKFAIAAMSQQVLADSNYYCKLDQGTLIASSQTNSDTENGIIVWDTPYAQRQYYFENAHKDKNPNAQMMWFHKAKDIHGEEWTQSYRAAFSQRMR